MILDQFALGGSNGEYPINNFTLELNYDRTSKLVVNLDSSLINEIKNETFLMFYYLDNCLFEGIPYFVTRNGSELELTIYDKTCALWTAGGFALNGDTGILEFNDTFIYDICCIVLKGSQFTVTRSSVPTRQIDISGNWASKTDFFFSIAKQCVDGYGNTCTVWVDNKNVVHIGSLNAGRIINMSGMTSGHGKEDINLINFGGCIVQGGKTTAGMNIIEVSSDTSLYTDYDVRKKSLGNYNIVYTPTTNAGLARVSLNNGIYRFGFDKPGTARISYTGAPNSDQVRGGNSYSNSVMLLDRTTLLDYAEIDMAFEVYLDRNTELAMDTWMPYYACAVYDGWGQPYTFIHNATVGLNNPDGEQMISVTIERYCDAIQFYKPNQYQTIGRSLNDEGWFRFFINFETPNTSIGFVNPTPFSIMYNGNQSYHFIIWFSRRFNGTANEWHLKVIKKNDAKSVWVFHRGSTSPADALFDGTIAYEATGQPSSGMNAGGIPFIRSSLQTNIDKNLKDAAWYIKPIAEGSVSIPMFIATPQKSIQHKPYLFYSDTNVKSSAQARTLAKNLYTDFSKTISADIEIDPLKFFYPITDKIDVGCIAELDSPSPVTGSYRIRGITATPSSVNISLQNRTANVMDVVDRLQKQAKDLGVQ